MKSISKVLSILLAVLLMISAPLSAFAADYDIGDGDITVRAEDSRQTVEQGGAEADDDAPVIVGYSDMNVITVYSDADSNASLTLSDVTAGALSVTGEGSATIVVDGSNTIDSTQLDPDDYWYGGSVANGSTTLEGTGTVCFTGNETGLRLKNTSVEVDGATISAAGEEEGIYSSNSTLIVTSGSVAGSCDSDDGICFSKSSCLIVNGGSVTGTGDTTGIYFDRSDADVNGGSVTGVGNQNGIYVYHATLDVDGGTVTGNYNDDSVGDNGIYLSYSALDVNGGTVIGTGDENGIYVNQGLLAVDSGNVTGSGEYDNGIYVKSSTMMVNGGGVNGSGGENGIRIVKSEATVTGGTILGVGSDEGISIDHSTVSMDDGVVSGTCQADDGIYVNESALTVNGGSFTGRSGFLGMYIDQSDVSVNGGDLSGIGGAQGIALRAGGTVVIDEGTGEASFSVTNPATLKVQGGSVTGIASGNVPDQVIAATIEEVGYDGNEFYMPTAGILVNRGVSVVVTDGTVTGSTSGSGNAAMCGGIYMSDYATLTTDDGLQITDSGNNDVTDASLSDPTSLNASRKAVIQKQPSPENDDPEEPIDPENNDPENDDPENNDPENCAEPESGAPEYAGTTITIDGDGAPEIIFYCSRRGARIEKIGEPDAAAMEILSRDMEGAACIYKGSFAFVDGEADYGSIQISFILPAYAGQHVVIATVADGAQVTYDRWVSQDGIAAITVDHLGDFAVFLG